MNFKASLKDTEQFYTQRFAVNKEALIKNLPSPELKISIVIPSFDEPHLDATIQSLEANILQLPEQAEIIIVFNHAKNASTSVKEKHAAQYEKWQAATLKNGVPVYCLRAFDLPPKKAGVGLARKIGMDEALKRFAKTAHDGMIICLDADCTVSKNYISSLLRAESEGWKGLSIYYEHDWSIVKDEVHLVNIINYEIFLYYYSLALERAGYPYYWQTVGSCMAARASIYGKIGGMNSRKAGEDFYFLHKLFPQETFTYWTDCTVYPSPRFSERVPFGTGRAMIKAKDGSQNYEELYHPQIFLDLKASLQMIEDLYEETLNCLPESMKDFIKEEELLPEIEKVRNRSNTKQQFRKNFFFWFDGFKILKYVHSAQINYYPDLPNTLACNILLKTNGKTPKELVKELRELSLPSPKK